jgi:hypothetical protein
MCDMFARIAARVMMGKTLRELGLTEEPEEQDYSEDGPTDDHGEADPKP